MRKTDRKSCSILLILLFVGSFILHPLIHGSGGCGHEVFSAPQIAGTSLAASLPERCLPAEHRVCSSEEFFCPVCAGWLTTDCPERSGFTPVCRSSQAGISATDDPAAAPDWRLPSPRAPPAA